MPCTDADGETRNSYTHAGVRLKMQGLGDDQQWVKGGRVILSGRILVYLLPLVHGGGHLDELTQALYPALCLLC